MADLREVAEQILEGDYDGVQILAKAYLADNRADDNGPVTEEWLETTGLGDEDVCKLRKIGNFYFKHLVIVTRRDVRRLCQALGVELISNEEDDVREAAGRLRRYASGEPAQVIYGTENATESIELRRIDRKEVIDDYLAEHPTDETNLADVAWMRSEGFRNKTVDGMEDDVFELSLNDKGWYVQWGRNSKQLAIVVYSTGYAIGISLMCNPTRGDVRKLVAALRIK